MDGNKSIPSCVASGVPFYHFASLCEKISTTQGKEKKKQVLKSFLSHWRETHTKLHGNDKTTDSFFIPLRFLLPQFDNERLSYGMKEVFLAKYYIDILNISKDSKDGKMLLNYRAPSSAKGDAGDFASVAYVILKNRCPEKGTLTILDINEVLESVAQANAEKQRDEIKRVLQKVVRSTSALEQKWMLRIILKEMKFGLNENSIFPTFHPDALELYNVCNSLSKVCSDLHDLNVKLNETEIILCTPFRPMLGQRVNIEDIEKLMNYEEFFIETKIDGERMQIHKDGDEFYYFSRSSIEYTKQFGASRHRGTLTPFIADYFKADIHSCILDGEMVGFDEELNEFVLKASNIDVKSDHMSGVHPCFVAFDILMINNEKLANVPLKERIEKIQDVFDVCGSRLQHVGRKNGKNSDDVVAAINYAIDNREEGIVIKDPNSTYKPSKRKGSGWLKLKPEYLEGVGDDLDLLIVGGFYGSGHRGGMISHFLLGVCVASDNPQEKPSLFMTFGKVGSGYTNKELKVVSDKLNHHWKLFDTSNPPKHILFTNGFKEKPDVWIEPESSIIVQIKAAEITNSERYKTGCTMRFPRLEKFRDDKLWHECMTYGELEDLRKMAGGKLSYKLADGNESSPSKKRRVVVRVEQPRTVADHLKSADLSNIKEVSQLFMGKEFCIINGPANFPKQNIEKKVAEFGGTIVQNPTADTICVIAEKENLRVKSIMKCGNIDIVQASWILECFEKHMLLPYTMNQMLFTTEKTKSIFQLSFDKYGDNYTEDINSKQISNIFSNIKHIGELVTPHHIAKLERLYFGKQTKFSLFRGITLYVCPSIYLKVNDLEFVALEFRLHGGSIHTNILENETTHILIDTNEDNERVATIRGIIELWMVKPCIITPSWILDCLEANRIICNK